MLIGKEFCLLKLLSSDHLTVQGQAVNNDDQSVHVEGTGQYQI